MVGSDLPLAAAGGVQHLMNRLTRGPRHMVTQGGDVRWNAVAVLVDGCDGQGGSSSIEPYLWWCASRCRHCNLTLTRAMSVRYARLEEALLAEGWVVRHVAGSLMTRTADQSRSHAYVLMVTRASLPPPSASPIGMVGAVRRVEKPWELLGGNLEKVGNQHYQNKFLHVQGVIDCWYSLRLGRLYQELVLLGRTFRLECEVRRWINS